MDFSPAESISMGILMYVMRIEEYKCSTVYHFTDWNDAVTVAELIIDKVNKTWGYEFEKTMEDREYLIYTHKGDEFHLSVERIHPIDSVEKWKMIHGEEWVLT